MKINKIYNEDCFDTMKQMKNDFVDITITSPPYNTGGISLCVGDFYKEYKDNLTNDEYYNFIKKNINELLRVTKHYVFYNFQFLSNNKNIYFNIIGEFSHKIKDVFIWEKASAVAQINKGKMATGFEVVLILSKNNNNAHKSYFMSYLIDENHPNQSEHLVFHFHKLCYQAIRE